MVLLVGAAGDRERAAVFERDGAATGRHLAVAGHDQALEPGLTGHAAQLLRRLLEAGGGVRLVRRDIDADRAGEARSCLRLDASSTVLLIGTEGATDQDIYEQLVCSAPAEVTSMGKQ